MVNLVIGLLFAVSLGDPGLLPAQGDAPATETYTAECTLTNPAYTGSCIVTESAPRSDSPATVCDRVLSCLNDTKCTKTYCNATTVRSGWRVDQAKEQGK